MREAEEGEPYLQHSFFPLGFNEATYKFEERYLQEN